MDKIKEALLKIQSAGISIIYINPSDLEEIDLTTIDEHIWFVAEPAVEKGTGCVLNYNAPIRLEIYKILQEHPELVVKGLKHGD